MEEEKGHSATFRIRNIIASECPEGGESICLRKKYALHVMHVTSAHPTESKVSIQASSFSHIVVEGIIPHEDNPIVINLEIHDLNVKIVLIDHDI